MKEEWQLIISGTVQGVFYRANIISSLEKDGLQITGHIQNLSNGTVKVLAQGTEENLNKLIALCKKGSKNSIVTDIQITKSPISENFIDFSIKK